MSLVSRVVTLTLTLTEYNESTTLSVPPVQSILFSLIQDEYFVSIKSFGIGDQCFYISVYLLYNIYTAT